MNSKKRLLIQCILIPLAVGVLSSILSGGMGDFQSLNKPPLSPPGWIFPVVWTVLYILMGIASFLVLSSGAVRSDVRRAMLVYGLQLVVNFFWSIFFFRFDWYLFSFLWLVLLWLLIYRCQRLFWDISRPAGLLLLPYLIWVTFAGYLNLGIAVLN